MQKEQMKMASQEDPDLLVWRVPFEFTVPEASIQVFALPLLSRRGGLLLAIPAGVFLDDVLLDAAIEEEGLLGPSRDFEAGLLEEDDDAVPQEIGRKCSFLVIDCNDAVCQDLRRYDPVTDSTEEIKPFDSQRPSALPAVGDILSSVQEWIESVALQRAAFYSAREEQEPTPKVKAAASKKATAAKRVTNTALADQVATLSEHMKLLAAQQEELLKSHQSLLSKSSPAGPVVEPGAGGITKRPGMPALSSVLPNPKAGFVSATAKLVGPPPKVRSVPDAVEIPTGPSQDEPQDPLS